MTLHYTIISKMPYILSILKWSQVYTLTNFCSQKYCQQFLYDSHLKLSSLSYYTVHTSLTVNLQGVPSISTQFWFQFLTFLIFLSKKSNLQFKPKWFNLDFATVILTKFLKLINFFKYMDNGYLNKAKNQRSGQ